MKGPNTFIVGAPKTGTTSMYEYLRNHPQVYLPDKIKEPHFFGSDLSIDRKRWELTCKNKEHYFSLFADAQAEPVIGEASTWYLFSEKAAEEIARFNPDSRILIMLRQPVDLMYSLHGHFLWDGNEEVTDFERALALAPERAAGRHIPRSAHLPQGLQYRQVIDYPSQLKRYFDHFPAEQIKYLIFEDFVEDPASAYLSVLDFLGIEANALPDFTRHNSAKTSNNPPLKRFFKRHHRLKKALLSSVPSFWHVGASKLVSRLIPYSRRDKKIDPLLRQTLTEELQGLISETEELLNINLDAWRQPKP